MFDARANTWRSLYLRVNAAKLSSSGYFRGAPQ